MFSQFLSSLFSSGTSDTSHAKDASSNSGIRFTNQEDILKQAGAPANEAGICFQLTNLYTGYEIDKKKNKEQNFLNDSPDKVYEKAMVERKHQETLLQQGEDGYHSAFVDNAIPYQWEVVKAEEVKTKEGLGAKLEKVEHAMLLFEVPSVEKKNAEEAVRDEKADTGSVRSFHQVAVGHDSEKKDQCYLFDANIGAKTASCPEIYGELSSTLFKYMAPKADEVLIVSDRKHTISYTSSCQER